ncbi:MAG: hypothetical protein JNJ56_14515 [Ignavibacteria bacterium]|nr:hypothetical protein [Ignavibacteria bacterium]
MRTIYILLITTLFPFTLYCQDNENDYYSIVINTGDKPECIPCKVLYDRKLDNFLRIDATGSTDVVVKIINKGSENCIRCVYISGGSVYEITNIPEGIYYLKIAYGYDWSKKTDGNFCYAKFMREAHYQIGNDLLDYFLKKTDYGYQVPSYELELKVITNNRNNEFDAEDISEEEFYR